MAEAYDVLTDSNKRAVYDQYGEEGLKVELPHVPRRSCSSYAFLRHCRYDRPGDPHLVAPTVVELV